MTDEKILFFIGHTQELLHYIETGDIIIAADEVGDMIGTNRE